MKWKGAYSTTAYCPDCWCRWEVIEIDGFDEETPLVCPNCGKDKSRIYSYGDLNGDKLREADRLWEIQKKNKEKKDDEPGE